MISLSETAAAIVTGGSYDYRLSVESWLGDELLADDIPVESASETTDRGQRVPERVTLNVPRVVDGYNWSPIAADHPLAWYGQRLRVQLGVGIGPDGVEWFNRGEFVVTESKPDGDLVRVTAVGLLGLVDEARLVSPYQPAGTFISTLRGLIEPALTVDVDAGLVDRAVPTGINYDEDRLGAVNELLDAWPATARVTEDGYLLVEPVTTVGVPVLALTNQPGGTLIEAVGEGSRSGAFSIVVARGTAADGGQVQGVAAAPQSTPIAYGGAFNPLPVPFFFPSPLLTTVAQCQAAAQTVLTRKLREYASQTFRAEIVPHPGVQAGDVASITTDEYTDLTCTVEGLTLPYLPDGNPMQLTLRSV